jgi:outer membrane lipoprotein-sorting protein
MLVALLASMTSPCPAQSTTDEMIDAVVARGTALFSAKIAFQMTSTIAEGEREIVEETQRYILSLSGEDWILRHPPFPDFIMNFDDSTIHFYQTESEKTGIHRSLQMSAPTTIAELLSRDYSLSAARNGTLWYRPQLDFIDQQRHRVERRDGEVIDGHSTVLLRWRVGARDLDDAIIVVPRKMQEDLAGFLHLYTAPSLAYALPRIDYLTLDGQLARRYESSEFVEVDRNLFFPKWSRCIAYDEGERHSTTFTVSDIEHVNQDLPNEEFKVKVPKGTRVRDSRPGSPQLVFQLGNQKDIDEVTEVVDATNSKDVRFGFRMACLAANGLLVLLLLTLWIRRQCRLS